jgi:hypothetical protein
MKSAPPDLAGPAFDDAMASVPIAYLEVCAQFRMIHHADPTGWQKKNGRR